MPDASPEDRERAREVLRQHALLLIRIGERVVRDQEVGEAEGGEGPWEVPEVQKSW